MQGQDTRCSQCGNEIKDQKNIVRRDGKTFCSETCAQQSKQG